MTIYISRGKIILKCISYNPTKMEYQCIVLLLFLWPLCYLRDFLSKLRWHGVMEILSNEKPSDTHRSRRTQTLFYASGPWWAHTQNSGPWAVKLWILIGKCKRLGYEWTCWCLRGGLTLGVRDQSLLGESSVGPVSRCLFTERDKERLECVVISTWHFLSWPWNHGLTSSF
jgi:hypothetical protein